MDADARRRWPEQLEYARLDTHYLPEIADRLAAELTAKGRLAWFEESCASVVHAAMQEDRVDSREGWRIKGSRLLLRRPAYPACAPGSGKSACAASRSGRSTPFRS